jgi:TolB protein
MRPKSVLATMLPLAVLACGDLSPTEPPTALADGPRLAEAHKPKNESSAHEGFLLFTTDRDNPSTAGICAGCEEIYSSSTDGMDLVRLTDNGFNDSGAAWSNETETIAFQTNRSGHTQIFLMNVDGTDQRLLADLGVNAAGTQLGAQFPSWSPDGDRLCFSSQLRPREIYVVGMDGAAPINITQNGADDLRCDWSARNDRIAFGSTRDGNEEIYTMDPDGSAPMRLTFMAGADANPAWSPDANRIAFESNRDGNPEIYVMNADGSEQTRLTDYSGQDTKPSWSPQGDRIAFHRRIDGHLEVMSMAADGTDVVRLTTTVSPGFSGFPAWAKGKLHR